MCAGARACMQVHICVCRCMYVCAGARMCANVCAGACMCTQVHMLVKLECCPQVLSIVL